MGFVRGGEEVGGGFTLFDEEEEDAIAGGWDVIAGVADGKEDGISRRGRLVLRGEEEGDVEGGCTSSGGFADGDEEDMCSRGRFAAGDEAGRVGEGELESKGRLR